MMSHTSTVTKAVPVKALQNEQTWAGVDSGLPTEVPRSASGETTIFFINDTEKLCKICKVKINKL